MTLVRSLGARRPRAARAWACASMAATMLTSLVVQGLASHDGTNATAVTSTVLVLGLVVLVLRLPAERVSPWLVLFPLLGVAILVVLDLGSHDAGVTGQVFLVLPVIWAAAHLRAAGVVVVTAASTAADAVVVLSVLPREDALVDLSYTTVLLVAVAAVLGRSTARQEVLVLRLRHQADSDALTGLATRRVLDSAATRVEAATGGALLLVDLDGFKAVNDTHGHLGGDAALVHVASLLRSACREGDVAARMGGDELAVLLVGCSADDARRRAQDVVALVRATPLVLPDGTSVPLSVSAGVAAAAATDGSFDALYGRADAALYAAKRAGRDRAVSAPHQPPTSPH